MPRKKTDPLRELIDAPCLNWPACPCGQKLEHYARILPADGMTLEAVEWIRLDLACALSCAAHRCPDKQFRQHATIQLMHPVFAQVRGI